VAAAVAAVGLMVACAAAACGSLFVAASDGLTMPGLRFEAGSRGKRCR